MQKYHVYQTPPGANGFVPAGVVCYTFYNKCTLGTNCTKDTKATTSCRRIAFQFTRMFDSVGLAVVIFDENFNINLFFMLIWI